MNQQELFKAKNPDLIASIKAIKRAAMMARKIAIQTDTDLVVMRDHKIVRITAKELRNQYKE